MGWAWVLPENQKQKAPGGVISYHERMRVPSDGAIQLGSARSAFELIGFVRVWVCVYIHTYIIYIYMYIGPIYT